MTTAVSEVSASTSTWGLTPGDEVVRDCTVQRLVGGGTSYEAYLAFDEQRLTPVVVKVVRPHLVDDPSTLRTLAREIDVVGRLAHPVVVRGFHAESSGARPYIALERLHGPSLAKLIRRHGALDLDQVIPLALEICSALHYLHARGVVHLDVKPSNIIMDTVPRLIDFSIARSVEQAAALDHTTGTDRYLAPEQADPPRTGAPGPASDVWGLGATLFHAIAGYRPFPDGSRDPDAPAEARWPQLIEPALDLPASVPAPLAQIVGACLSRDPEQRPTPREVFDVLDPAMERLPKPRVAPLRVR